MNARSPDVELAIFVHFSLYIQGLFASLKGLSVCSP